MLRGLCRGTEWEQTHTDDAAIVTGHSLAQGTGYQMLLGRVLSVPRPALHLQSYSLNVFMLSSSSCF